MGGNVTNAPVHLPSGVVLEGFNPNVVYYGRIVPMDGSPIIDDGAMCVSSNMIKAVQPRSAPLPAGFGVGAATQVETGGTIFPGLIELHTHRYFNVLPMAVADQKYSNRDQWRESRATNWFGNWWYRASGSTPIARLTMARAGEAVSTFVDTKALVAGTTTTQALFISYDENMSWTLLPSLVRTVESTGDSRLPFATSRVDDYDSDPGNARAQERPLDYDTFSKQLEFAPGAYLMHLCEGFNLTDLSAIVRAHEHFEILSKDNQQQTWPLTSAFAGIHCLALTANDFATLAAHNSSFVWSPMSNFVLYGQTADVKAAKTSGVLIGLGADWSLTGSKNLFGEIKVARAVNDYFTFGFTDQEIVAMATINGAKILHWDHLLGSLTVGKYADFMVLDGTDGDPYLQFISSLETSITLVAIGGKAYFGRQDLMAKCGATGELIVVGSEPRVVVLRDPSLTYAAAATAIRDILHRPVVYGPRLPGYPTVVPLGDPVGAPVETLNPGVLSAVVGSDAPPPISSVVGGNASQVNTNVIPFLPDPSLPETWELDTLTVADDGQYFQKLHEQKNLPAGLATAIQNLYVQK